MSGLLFVGIMSREDQQCPIVEILLLGYPNSKLNSCEPYIGDVSLQPMLGKGLRSYTKIRILSNVRF